MKNKKVIVGFSGGADSAAAVLILKNKGYEVLGVTFDFFGNEPLLEKASVLAKQIGIQHECINRQREFREKVIKPFISEYLRGYTPNPCVRCDAGMKFRGLMAYANEKEAEFIATGQIGRAHV